MAKLSKILDENGNTIMSIGAVTSLDVTSRNSLSKYPLQQGGVITENVAKDNLVIILQGVVSKADALKPDIEVIEKPLLLRSIVSRGLKNEYEVKVKGISSSKEKDFKSSHVEDARKDLRDIADSKRIVQIVNAANTYSNLIMTQLSFKKDSTVGKDSIRFNCTFEQITFATPAVFERTGGLGPYNPTSDPGTNPADVVKGEKEERARNTLLQHLSPIQLK